MARRRRFRKRIDALRMGRPYPQAGEEWRTMSALSYIAVLMWLASLAAALLSPLVNLLICEGWFDD